MATDQVASSSDIRTLSPLEPAAAMADHARARAGRRQRVAASRRQTGDASLRQPQVDDARPSTYG